MKLEENGYKNGYKRLEVVRKRGREKKRLRLLIPY
jgi:hypothetical protein